MKAVADLPAAWRRAVTAASLGVAAALLMGCGEPTRAPENSAIPSQTSPRPSQPAFNYPDPGELAAMSDGEFVTALRAAVPWTWEISEEILIYAGKANCVVHNETRSIAEAMADAEEQGFEGDDATAFISASVQAFCPSRSGHKIDTGAPTVTDDRGPRLQRAEVAGGDPWIVDLTWEAFPGALGYEVQYNSYDPDTATRSDWQSSTVSGGDSGGTRQTHSSRLVILEYRVRAVLEDNQVTRWSNPTVASHPSRQ